ncbi:MAG TPA: NrdH-redoxin [Aminobacterium sp.]|nr:NrdH-redoxin [Aminobacterium sp.]
MIKVYSTPTCPWCTKTKEYLTSKGMIFEVIDVSQNREAAMDMVRKTGQMGDPVVQFDEKYIVGFDRQAIDEEIEKLKA